jgi:hypothetical protein
MPTPLDILQAVLIPSAVALILVAVGTRAWTRSGDAKGTWTVPVALGIAVLISLYVRRSFAGLNPVPAQDWLWHVASLTIVCGVLVWLFQTAIVKWIVPTIVACAGASYLLLKYRLNLEIPNAAISVAMPAILMVCATMVMHVFSRTSADWSVPLCFSMCAICLGSTVGFTGSQDFAMISTALGGALMSVAIVSFVRPIRISPVVSVPATVLFASMLALSHHLANLNDQREWPVNTVLFALAFVLSAMPGLSRLKPLPRAAIRLAIVLVPLLIATVPAAIAFFSKPENPYDGLY